MPQNRIRILLRIPRRIPYRLYVHKREKKAVSSEEIFHCPNGSRIKADVGQTVEQRANFVIIMLLPVKMTDNWH